MYMDTFFTNLSLVFVIAAGVSLLMRLLRQPLVVGYIITGLVAGPLVLDLTQHDNGFGILSAIGVSLLLFMVGLELRPAVLQGLRKVVLLTTFVQVAIVSVVGAVVAYSFDFGLLESLVLGLCLAMSSTIIVVTLLQQKKEITRLFGQISIGILIVQDLLSTSGKIALSTHGNGDGIMQLVLMLARGVAFITVIYGGGMILFPRIARLLEDSKELLLLVAVGWALGISALSARLGYSMEVGALFAGLSLANVDISHSISTRLRPMRDFFVVVFFIYVGATLTPEAVRDIWPAVIAFLGIVVILKPLTILGLMGLQGYTKRASFKTAMAMSQVSEFSLVFVAAALSHHYIGGAAYAALSLTALLSFIVSAYLIKYDDVLYSVLENKLRFFERRVTEYEQKSATRAYPTVLFGYRKGGLEFIRTFKSLNKRFVVVDYDPEVAEIIERHEVNFVYGDAMDLELLDELQLDKSKFVVCTISDFTINEFLAKWLKEHNPSAVFIGSADSAYDAAMLYASDASYVMTPHIIGSEKISNFIKRSGFGKSDFEKFKERHVKYLEAHFSSEPF